MTPFGRIPGRTLRTLSEQAAAAAIDDAGLTPRDIDMVLFGNAVEGVLHGQEMVRAEVALRYSGLSGSAMINVENACASSSTAFQLARMAIRSGAAEAVLVLGAERLVHDVKERSFAALSTAVDLSEHPDLAEMVVNPAGPGSGSHSPLMDLYAAKARSFMSRSDVTVDDLARVAVKNRGHAALNPLAQFRGALTERDVLSSRVIADPLRMLMCAPIGDGAAAVVVTSAERARTSGRPYVLAAGGGLTSNGADPRAAEPAARAARLAFDEAGVEPEDIDVAEVHDACAAAELWLYEDLGFAKPGAASELIRSGRTALGGRTPVNVSGGLLSRGHPLGATGCAQLVELADQLRGRAAARQVAGARIGLAHNSGGILDHGDEAVAAVTILRLP
jgi:acetyl-CoA acetyltransferase